VIFADFEKITIYKTNDRQRTLIDWIYKQWK